MTERYGIGIVGAGVVFKDHARAYQALSDRASLVGIAEIDSGKLDRATTDFFAPVATRDYRQLLERDDIHIIDICSPPQLHREMVESALRAGKIVICEKPMAQNLAEADAIVELAEEFPNRVSVVFQLRYLPAIEKMIWLRDSGRLGNLHLAHFRRIAAFERHRQGMIDWWGAWATAGGGALMTQFIHNIDLLYHLLGPASEVTGSMETLVGDIESEDTVVATIRFESGAMAQCISSLAAHGDENVLDVFADQASVHLPWQLKARDARVGRALNRALSKRMPLKEKIKLPSKAEIFAKKVKRKLFGTPRPSSHTPYLSAVLDALDSGGELPTQPREARASLEICTAIYTAALTGERVTLPLDRSSPYYAGVSTTDYNGHDRLARRSRRQR